MRSLLIPAALLLALVACGQKEPVAASPTPPAVAAATTAVAPAAAVVAENPVGKSTFGKVCALCHAGGVGGAPRPGDKADWGPRIAKGMDVLHQHALQGFTGDKGTMPPRGGMPTLTDDEVKAGVDYMASLSR
jgi:cytochrome c5